MQPDADAELSLDTATTEQGKRPPSDWRQLPEHLRAMMADVSVITTSGQDYYDQKDDNAFDLPPAATSFFMDVFGSERHPDHHMDLTEYDLSNLNLSTVEKQGSRGMLYITVSLPGHPRTQLLVDSGARIGILDKAFCPPERLDGGLKPTRLRLRLPFGELRQCLGWLDIGVTFHDRRDRKPHKVKLWFLVVDNCIHHGLLGLNNQRALDMKVHTAKVGPDTITLTDDDGHRFAVRAEGKKKNDTADASAISTDAPFEVIAPGYYSGSRCV